MKLQLTIAAIMIGTSLAAQNVSPADLLLQEARHKQQVEGDLSGAIKIYQQIANTKNGDRAIIAKALLGLASCYEKQGKLSETVYQQIVHDFPDQPAAGEARRKLAALRKPEPSAMTLRKIETGDGVQNIIATDGKKAVYWDTSRTTILLGDLAGKEKHVVFQAKPDRRPGVIVSRDLSMALFRFGAGPLGPAGYAVIKTDGTGYRDLPSLGKAGFSTVDWSWDDRYILLRLNGKMEKVSVSDGEMVEILPGLAADISWAEFSPDSRYIAYSKGQLLGPIYVVPAQGGQPQLVVPEDATLMDWTHDGKYLLIGERRSEALALYAVPIKNGQRAGEQTFIRNVGEMLPGPVTYGGSMVYAVLPAGSGEQVSLGVLDAEGHLGPWKRLDLLGRGSTYPVWSPDGSQFAYISRQVSTPLNTVIRLQNVATGEDRELYRAGALTNCVWESQHPNLLCGEFAGQNTSVLSVTVESGRAEKIGSLDGARYFQSISPDDRMLNMTKIEDRKAYRWEIGTDHDIKDAGGPYTSRDGARTFALPVDADNRIELRIRPTSGTAADWKHLTYLHGPGMTNFGVTPFRFSPDGNWVVFPDRDPNGVYGLYRISASGGEPERLGDYVSSHEPGGFLAIGLDGRRFIVATPPPRDQQPEFWLLDNFLPVAAPAAPKTTAKAAAK